MMVCCRPSWTNFAKSKLMVGDGLHISDDYDDFVLLGVNSPSLHLFTIPGLKGTVKNGDVCR